MELPRYFRFLLFALLPLLGKASQTPGRYVVPLQRQRVPVKSEDEVVSLKSVYFGTITVGSPQSQRFSVVFDTGSGHVIVPSKECRSETCMIHNRYDRKASLDAVDVDYDGTPVQPGQPRDQITVAFGTGEVTGQFVDDRLCLGLRDSQNAENAPKSQAEAYWASTSPGPATTVLGSEQLALLQSAGSEIAHRLRANLVNTSNQEPLPISAPPPTAVQDITVLETVPEAEDRCIRLRIVMATEMTEEPFHAFAFDGVLGLGLDALALAPEFSFFGMMVAQHKLEQPAFGVFLADSDHEHSEISFGGISPERVVSPLSWAPVASPDLGYWQVQIKALRIGNRTLDYCKDGQCHAVVDTGTSLLAVPSDFADELQEELERPLRSPLPNLLGGGIDCRLAEGTPLHFDVEGTTLTLEPGDYARQAIQLQPEQEVPTSPIIGAPNFSERKSTSEMDGFVGESSCKPTLMAIDLPEPLGPKLFIWGEPVLRKYYTVYDWEQKRIGFGLAAHVDGATKSRPTSGPAPTAKRPLLFA